MQSKVEKRTVLIISLFIIYIFAFSFRFNKCTLFLLDMTQKRTLSHLKNTRMNLGISLRNVYPILITNTPYLKTNK